MNILQKNYKNPYTKNYIINSRYINEHLNIYVNITIEHFHSSVPNTFFISIPEMKEYINNIASSISCIFDSIYIYIHTYIYYTL